MAHCRLSQAKLRKDLAGADGPFGAGEQVDDLDAGGIAQRLEQTRRRLCLLVRKTLGAERAAA
jgi:hypothetical protein